MKKIFSVLLFLVVICQIRAEDTNITTMRKMTQRLFPQQASFFDFRLLNDTSTDSFTIKSAIIGVFTTFLIGIQRGIFATESGLGSGAIASATTDSNNKIGQGMIQMLGIYFTTFVICTSTAFIILTSDYQTLLFENINGIEITQYALTYHLGNLGSVFLNLVIIFFAFSTILTGYYYGEVNFKYLVPNWKNSMLVILKIITILLLLWGSVAKATFLWNIVDILVALMAIINMYALFRLRQEVVKEYKSYQQKSG